MRITEIKIFLVQEPKLKAYVTITLENSLVIRDLKVIQGGDSEDSLFVAMPSKKKKDGGFQDVVHPIHQEARFEMEQAILAAYHKELEKKGSYKNGWGARIRT